jgi:hypothetical protein
VTETNACLPGSRPIADAGANITVVSGQVGTLDGTASHDPDNGALVFDWEQTTGLVLSLSDSTVAQPTFTAPIVATNKTAVFQLLVTDPDHRQSAPATVTVTIVPAAAPDAAVDGMPDAAPMPDAALIDALPPADATDTDAGNPETGGGGGCCSVGSDPRGGILLALGVILTLRRRGRCR